MALAERLPFTHLSSKEWRNLTLAAVLTLYLAYVGSAIFKEGIFASLGGDYLAFWGVGRIANTRGYAYIYDLDQQLQIQKQYAPNFVPSMFRPVAFLPVFILPFQALARLPLTESFLFWTGLNLLGMILYLRFFIRDTMPAKGGSWFVTLLLLSFPVFWNFFWGQVSVFLMICTGEFFRSFLRGRPFRAGVWLGGLLIKPQLLILIVPALLLYRSWKALAGFATTAGLLLIVSLRLIGWRSPLDWLNVLRTFSAGLPGVNIEGMMNWRMLAVNLDKSLPPIVAWGLAVAGMLITAVIALSLWDRSMTPGSRAFAVAVLGTLAATGAVTWHAHLHMLMILIPVLVYLHGHGRVPARLLDLWVFSFPVALFAALTLGVLMRYRWLPLIWWFRPVLFLGVSGLLLNLYLVAWSFRMLKQEGGVPARVGAGAAANVMGWTRR